MGWRLACGTLGLAGGLLGILIYLDPALLAVGLGALVLLWLITRVGMELFPDYPVLGGWMIETAILRLAPVAALATSAILWLTLDINWSRLFGVQTPETYDELVKTATTAVATAIAAFHANPENEESWLGPVKPLRQSLSAAANKHGFQAHSKAFDAASSNSIEGVGAIGWAFADRRIRCRIVAAAVAQDLS